MNPWRQTVSKSVFGTISGIARRVPPPKSRPPSPFECRIGQTKQVNRTPAIMWQLSLSAPAFGSIAACLWPVSHVLPATSSECQPLRFSGSAPPFYRSAARGWESSTPTPPTFKPGIRILVEVDFRLSVTGQDDWIMALQRHPPIVAFTFAHNGSPPTSCLKMEASWRLRNSVGILNLRAPIYKRLALRSDLYRLSGRRWSWGVDRVVPKGVNCLHERVCRLDLRRLTSGRLVV